LQRIIGALYNISFKGELSLIPKKINEWSLQ